MTEMPWQNLRATASALPEDATFFLYQEQNKIAHRCFPNLGRIFYNEAEQSSCLVRIFAAPS